MTATTITLEELKNLMACEGAFCLSLYMPTQWQGTGTDTQQNQIRFKNMIRKAEDQLLESGMKVSDIKTFLHPAQELLSEAVFWKNQSKGFALFLADGTFKYFKTLRSFNETVLLSKQFHLKPLIPLFEGATSFFILAFSQNNVRLIRCTGQTAQETILSEAPTNMNEALNLDTFEKRRQRHTGGEDVKANLHLYFQILDKALKIHITDRQTPLLFAGVDYAFPIFRETTTFPAVTDRHISGNPEDMSIEELHQKGLLIIEDIHGKALEEAKNQYRQHAGTGHASDNLREIVPAAFHGRVSLLFMTPGIERWGAYDPRSGEIRFSEKEQQGDVDLVDLAAIHTLMNGGAVHTLNVQEMVGNDAAAALFRY